MKPGVAIATVLLTALRIGVGALFIYAGAMKIAEPQLLADEIKGYKLNHLVSVEAPASETDAEIATEDAEVDGSEEAAAEASGGAGEPSKRPLVSDEAFRPVVTALAFLVPWTEVIAGSLLVMGARTRSAALIVVGMLVVYLLGYWSVISRGMDLSCSCFGETDPFCGDRPIGVCHVLRNAGFLVAALLSLIFGGTSLSMDGTPVFGKSRVDSGGEGDE